MANATKNTNGLDMTNCLSGIPFQDETCGSWKSCHLKETPPTINIPKTPEQQDSASTSKKIKKDILRVFIKKAHPTSLSTKSKLQELTDEQQFINNHLDDDQNIESLIKELASFHEQSPKENVESLQTKIMSWCFKNPITSINQLKKLQSLGVDIQSQNEQDQTLLHYAAIRGFDESSAASIKTLLDMGFNALSKDKKGRIPLHYAADCVDRNLYTNSCTWTNHEQHTNQKKAVAALVTNVQYGSQSLDVEDNGGATPLLLAYKRKNFHLAHLVVSKNNIGRHTFGENNRSLLSEAIIEYPASERIKKSEFNTFIKTIIEYGGDIRSKRSSAPPPPMPLWFDVLVFSDDNIDLAKYVIEKLTKDEINERLNGPATALTITLECLELHPEEISWLEKASILISKGASVTAQNEDGQSAMDIALKIQRKENKNRALDQLISEMKTQAAKESS